MHEAIHVVQNGLPGGVPRWGTPRYWIVEALAEYDAYRYSTAWNRETGLSLVVKRVYEDYPTEIFYAMAMRLPGHVSRGVRYRRKAMIRAADVYMGGTLIAAFFADEFGEDIHLELWQHDMEDVVTARGTGVWPTFQKFNTWFFERAQRVSSVPRLTIMRR